MKDKEIRQSFEAAYDKTEEVGTELSERVDKVESEVDSKLEKKLGAEQEKCPECGWEMPMVTIYKKKPDFDEKKYWHSVLNLYGTTYNVDYHGKRFFFEYRRCLGCLKLFEMSESRLEEVV